MTDPKRWEPEIQPESFPKGHQFFTPQILFLQNIACLEACDPLEGSESFVPHAFFSFLKAPRTLPLLCSSALPLRESGGAQFGQEDSNESQARCLRYSTLPQTPSLPFYSKVSHWCLQTHGSLATGLLLIEING